MSKSITGLHRRTLTLIAIGLAVVLFFAANILAGLTLNTARIDLTADARFTVSDGTRAVLAGIDEPIRLRYYRSRQLDDVGAYFSPHAKRVDALLESYVELADGNLIVERYDPLPYSPEEDLAVADGVQSLAIDAGGSLAYFGIAGTNSTDDREVIPYLAPERGDFLEYDVTRLINDLANPDKKTVAVIGDLALRGDARSRFQPWLVTDVMEQFFNVVELNGTVERIQDDVDILLLAQPGNIDEQTLYAIDQFAVSGGSILAFIDPFTESQTPAGPAGMPGSPEGPGNAAERLAPLLAAWGVEVDDDMVVGDRQAAIRVRAMHDNRQVVTDYLSWLSLDETNAMAADPVVGDVDTLILKSAGSIRATEDATIALEPLLVTSSEAAMIPTADVQGMPDPVRLLRGFESGGEPLTLAARMTGQLRSAFPDGPPDDSTTDASESEPSSGEITDGEDLEPTQHRDQGDEPATVILVADADLLADESWVQASTILGQAVNVPIANNADLVLNALESLAGGTALASLRGRNIQTRRFEVVDAMTRRAEDEYRATEEALLAKIEDTRGRLRSLQEAGDGGGTILTAANQGDIEAARGELLALRGQLREVQFALHEDVNTLKGWLQALNIVAVPALVAIGAIVLASWRRRRAAAARESVAHGAVAAE